jgi:O-antigen/teichoic acid export membrane protein
MFFVQAAVQFIVIALMPARFILAGLERFGPVTLSSLVTVAGSAASIIFVLTNGQGPLVLTICTGLSSIAGAVILAVFALRHIPLRLIIAAATLPRVRRLLRLGLPVFVVQITAFLLRQQSNKLILGAFLGAAALSVYEIAAKLYSLSTQAIDTTVSALLPHVSALTARSEHERVDNTFLYGSRYLCFLLTPALALLFFAAPGIVVVWCGAEFALAGTVARLLLVAPLFWPMLVIGDSLLISKDRTGLWAPWSTAAAVANVGLAVCLIKPFGLSGVAFASCLGGCLELLFYVRVIFKVSNVKFRQWVGQVALPGLGTIACAAASFFALERLMQPASLLSYGTVLVASLLISWLGIALLFMRPVERRMFAQWIRTGLKRPA